MNPYLIVADAAKPPLKSFSARLVYADPPHHSGWDQTSHRLIASYQEFAQSWLTAAIRILDVDSYLIICVDDTTRHIYERLMQIKLEQSLIWYYDFGTYTRKRFVPSHTTLLIYKYGKPKFYWEQIAEPSQRMEKNDLRADWRGRTPGTVLAIPRVPGNSSDRRYIGRGRSCQPTELLETLVKAYTSNKSSQELVVDLFSGSGSMAVACRKLGRLCVSMDIEEQFIKEGYQRVHEDWRRYTG